MGKKLRSREACKILGIHRNTIVKWVDQGRLHPYRVTPTANRKYDEDELRRLLKEDEDTEARPELTAVYCRVSSAEQKTKETSNGKSSVYWNIVPRSTTRSGSWLTRLEAD